MQTVLAILLGLTASAFARGSFNGPSDADTYTGGFLYWLGYSGFDFGVVVAGIVAARHVEISDRASIAATSLLSVTMLAFAVLACSANDIVMSALPPESGHLASRTSAYEISRSANPLRLTLLLSMADLVLGPTRFGLSSLQAF